MAIDNRAWYERWFDCCFSTELTPVTGINAAPEPAAPPPLALPGAAKAVRAAHRSLASTEVVGGRSVLKMTDEEFALYNLERAKKKPHTDTPR